MLYTLFLLRFLLLSLPNNVWETYCFCSISYYYYYYYSECEIVKVFTGHSVWWTKVIHQTESTFTRRKKIVIFLIFHCWWLACTVSFTCIKPISLLLILIRVVFLFHIPMSYETNKEKNGMGTQIFITIYIPNSFIVNILSPREGKRLSNYLLHP